MKIESSDRDIRTLLSSGYYKIPRFQRPYSWDKENIQEFWDDVVKDAETDYFIGSMVVYKDGKQRFGIVDGQQRLTTIAIILCVLRNALEQIEYGDLAEGINGLIERKNLDNKPEFVLTTESSFPFFQDHILKWGKPEVEITELKEEFNLKSAFDQLNKLVSASISGHLADPSLKLEKKRERAKNRLISIRDSVLDLKLIFIELDNEDDAYIIFETLNTRGKDLNLSDLVKNHITKLLKTKSASVDQVKIKWSSVLETIYGSVFDLDVDTFIHHYWLSKYDYLPAKNLFKVVKKEIKKNNASDFLDSLVSDSKYYRSIHETSYGKWTKQEKGIEDSLNALMLFRVRQQTPCVLSLVREYRNSKIKKKHLEDALEAIEKFHFLFTAVTSQRSSGGISGMYASLGRRIFEAKNLEGAVSVIRELKKKLRERMPSIGEVKALFPNIIYTDDFTKQRKLIRYILVKLDEKNNKLGFDYDNMTIEHIIPQSKIGTENFTQEVVGQIGNLILVTEEINNKLKNKSFQEKKNILKESGYSIPDEIIKSSKWDKEDIIKRTEKMIDQAYNNVWKI